MDAAKKSAYVEPELDLRERIYITFASAKKRIRQTPLALKSRGDITRNPKQGYSGPKRTSVRQIL